MDSQLAVLLFTLLCHLTLSQAWNEAAKPVGHTDNESSAEKRQLVPLPRIGRSLMYSKRQSIIPAPRIGRSDPSMKASKAANAVDCSANPDLCENTGSSSGFAGSNDELVEPIDIQMRAAFIPRLGKRRVFMEEDNRASETADSGKAFHKFMFVPGLGYVDVDSANYAPEQDDEESEAQRSALIRTLLDNAKRAIPYTPRIGRAVFAPRIGKKATFVPRIG